MDRVMTTTHTAGLWESAPPATPARIAELEAELAEARERLQSALDGQHRNSETAAAGVRFAWAEALGLEPDEGLSQERLEAITLALRAALPVAP